MLTIGKLAERGGVNIQTVRYYERRGLLAKPERSGAGYRLYDEEAVQRLGFVRKAQSLGFSLQEIDELLALRMRPGTSCADIRQKANRKIAAVDAKLSELSRIRTALVKLARTCRGSGPTSECPILEELNTDNGHET